MNMRMALLTAAMMVTNGFKLEAERRAKPR